MRIAVDLMGGDHGAGELMPAILRCEQEFPDLSLALVGDEQHIAGLLPGKGGVAGRVTIVHAGETVEMTDSPSVALRQKRDSSMHVAIEQVRDHGADACVSAGNTGALMAVARHILKTVPGIDRPAIIKAIPSVKGRCYLLDLGANINCSAGNLVQFAAMGSLMCSAVEGVESPRVGLLNIGEEDVKGGGSVREAAQRLKQHPKINFIGFVEGDGIYQSDAEVLVCDGWVGNVALKTSEGLAKFVSYMIEQAFTRNVATKAAAVVSNPVLNMLREQLSPENYNGATLLGLNGIVVKSHGRARADGFYHAIRVAMREVEQDIPSLLQARIGEMLEVRQS